MPDFGELQLRAFYRTGEQDLVNDFYIPALTCASYYDRSSGFFTASAMPILARGLQVFLSQQGKIRMVIAPRLSAADQAAIREGIERRKIEELAQEILMAILEEAIREEGSSVRLLAALVASGRLEFRVAIPTADQGQGIYHEKFGLFGDNRGDWIAFTGSPNETLGGLVRNFESIAVFRRCAANEGDRITELRVRFEHLWDNNTSGAVIVDFPTAVRTKLLENTPRDLTSFVQRFVYQGEQDLREYQIQAIDAWRGAGFRGIWSMATGTGKTLAALRAIAARVQAKGTVLIIVPTKDLVDQWASVIERQRAPATVVCCYAENANWRKAAVGALLQRHLAADERQPAYLIATAATAIREDFHRVISTLPADELLLVGDEVHRLGAHGWQKALSIPAGLGRLGLSATPSRQWDPEGTAAIEQFFGGIVFEYGLQDALRDGWLCPYEYHLHLVGMEPDERAEYLDLTDRLSKLLFTLARHYGLPQPDLQVLLRLTRLDGDPQLELLLYSRADIVKGIRGKLTILEQLASNLAMTSCMVYCNDEAQVENALAILTMRGRRAVGFTSARLTGEDRPRILRDFSTGMYEFIVSIRCLDEGIDIPDARHALIMASSKTEREWIQRRGRLLRLAPGKHDAVIHDCIVVPARVDEDGNILQSILPLEASVTYGELKRAREFAVTALNSAQALLRIETVRGMVQRATSQI